MKWSQFFFIMAAIYISPRMGASTSLVLASALTIVGFVAHWRKE